MDPLRWLTLIFINTFGITQPAPEKLDRIAWLVAGLLALVLLGVVSAAFVIRAYIHP